MSFKNNLVEELRKGEYEAQFFDTSAISLAYSLRELMKALVNKCLDKLKLTLERNSENVDELLRIKGIIRKLRKRFRFAIEEHCKEMESKIYEIFNIPNHVLLPEDAAQAVQYSDTEEKNLDEEIRLLQLRYKRAVCMEALLKKQKKLNKRVEVLGRVVFEVDKDIDTFKMILEAKENSLKNVLDEIALASELMLTNTNIP